MKKIVEICLRALCCFLIAFSVSACARAAVTDDHTADYSAVDRQLEQDVKDDHIPAMAVIVVDKDKVLFSGTYGGCDSVDTPFIIGSLSKSFTALGVMQLVEQERIDLDASISEYMDCSACLVNPGEGDRITVRELLNHTSGLGRHQTFANARITDTRGRYGYSNVGYDLLGKIIEAVSGESYADYVEKNIFVPLGMTSSAATLEKSRENGLIEGYRNDFGFPVACEPNDLKDVKGQTAASGYLSASAADMGKYLQMYLNGGAGIITPDSIEKMFYNGVPTDDSRTVFYGMGWSYAEELMGTRRPVLNHSGLVENYQSNMFLFPDQNIGIAVLVNMNDYLVENNLIGNILLPLLGLEKQPLPRQTYLMMHVGIDVIYLALLLFAFYPLLRLKKWRNATHRKAGVAFDVFRHGIVAGLLALLPFLAGADYHMMWRFVRDAFAVVVISSAVLLCTGMYKITYWLKGKGRPVR